MRSECIYSSKLFVDRHQGRARRGIRPAGDAGYRQGGYPCAAGLADEAYDLEWIVELINEYEASNWDTAPGLGAAGHIWRRAARL